MKKRMYFRPVLLALTLLIFDNSQAQVSVLGNVPTNPPWDFVGWNSGVIDPVQIRHNGDQPIEMWTEGFHRFHLLPDAFYNIGNFNNQQKDGSLLLCPDVNNYLASGGPGPFSRLHLADETPYVNSTAWGYRPWMDNGMTITGNGDHMYIGQRFFEEEVTDATITWSDNTVSDRLSFNFTSTFSGVATGCGSLSGIQTMLIQPDVNCYEAYVGIGDFDAASVMPDERLDILDRTIRLRSFAIPSTQYETTTFDRVLVADPADGRVYWRNANTLGADCDWTIATGPNHISTAFGPAVQGCPDAAER